MRSLVNKSIKPIIMIVLTCLVALCFVGCASKSAELTKDGNFNDPPVSSYGVDALIVGEEAAVTVILNGVDDSNQNFYPDVVYSLVYLDGNNNVLFIDNVSTFLATGNMFYDDEYYGKVQKNGIPQYVQVYLSQIESTQSGDSDWGFSSEALGKMEDSDYLDAAVEVLKENAIDCGVAQLS